MQGKVRLALTTHSQTGVREGSKEDSAHSRQLDQRPVQVLYLQLIVQQQSPITIVYNPL